jgi:DNA polymerase-1
MAKRHILIDGDVLVYRFAHGEQQATRWNPGTADEVYTFHAKLRPAVGRISDFIEWLLEYLNGSSYTVVLSDLEGNFRYEIMEDYKAGRSGLVRPLLFHPLREWFFAECNAVMFPRLEGDDVLGVLGTKPTRREVVLASIDKDILTIPGRHFNWDKQENGVFQVTPGEAERTFLAQVLSGDATDGYPGVPGIGPVRAKKIIDKANPDYGIDLDKWVAKMAWPAILQAYEKAGLGEEVALMNARCARLLRFNDYDQETGEITLWTPTRKGE